ncbi:conserved hypothetical protein, partial [Ixodes scapularis]
GNLLVVVVVVVHRRMRTITNFFLTNLAVADLCVGLFCVYQNLSIYLMDEWPLGDFLCRMYFFVQALSYTASVGILTVICVERYIAIVHPMWSKHVITIRRLRIVVLSVWLVSAGFCSPRLVMCGTAEVPSHSDPSRTVHICIMRRFMYDSRLYDVLNFVVCFFIPLAIMAVMYSIIGLQLWRSSHYQQQAAATVLRARRKVVRLLVAVVLGFAVCNLPFHARKFYQYWSSRYEGASKSAVSLTILTTLILYMNSFINPILYAFLSDNFRRSMKDVLMCRSR